MIVGDIGNIISTYPQISLFEYIRGFCRPNGCEYSSTNLPNRRRASRSGSAIFAIFVPLITERQQTKNQRWNGQRTWDADVRQERGCHTAIMKFIWVKYWLLKYCSLVVCQNLFLLLLDCSVWPCLGSVFGKHYFLHLK